MNVKKSLKRFLRILSCICLIIVLGGCTIKSPSNGTTIRVNKEFKENEIFYVEEEVCTLGEAKLFLLNQENLYSGRYGEEIWDAVFEGNPLHSYLEENLYDFMIRLKSMVLMAAEKGLTLTEDDYRLISLASNDYWANLTYAEKTFCQITPEDVTDAFADYFLANRLFASLTKDAQKEISDDEARVITLQVIYLPKGSSLPESNTSTEEDTASTGGDEAPSNATLIQQLHQRATKEKEDFRTLAETYSKYAQLEIQVCRGELSAELEKAAFALSSGEISKVVNCEDGYYVLKCINNYEEMLTEEHRQELIESWKQQMFKAEYDQYVKTLYMRFNEPVWDTINFSASTPEYKVSFYSCYDEFLAGNE